MRGVVDNNIKEGDVKYNMQQNMIIGNQFQIHMWLQFNNDINSASASIENVIGRENLVYKYITDIAHLFHPIRYCWQGNPMGLYSDCDAFKKHFVSYWKNALDISRADLDEIRDIFDEAINSQESCRNMAITSVFFENGRALTIADCLGAVYEVLKIA